MTQVRADFAKADGTVLARLRIGNDTTIAGTDMAFRSRKGKVPPGAAQVTIVVTFAGGNNYKLMISTEGKVRGVVREIVAEIEVPEED